MSGINHWKGKVPFEDFVTERLYEIDNKLTETNRLLSVIAGESSEQADTDDLATRLVNAADILDDGKLNNSVEKKTGKFFKKRK
jgi:hypothetical protein